jgi:hypothetical protein
MSTEDTQRFLASLQAENATLLARCERAEATVAACRAAGFVDEKGIDDLARVAYEAFWEGTDTLGTWDGETEGHKGEWRRVVRRVLEANARKGAGDAPR